MFFARTHSFPRGLRAAIWTSSSGLQVQSAEDLGPKGHPPLAERLLEMTRGEAASNGLLRECPHGLLAEPKCRGCQLVLLRELRAEHPLIISLWAAEKQLEFRFVDRRGLKVLWWMGYNRTQEWWEQAIQPSNARLFLPLKRPNALSG